MIHVVNRVSNVCLARVFIDYMRVISINNISVIISLVEVVAVAVNANILISRASEFSSWSSDLRPIALTSCLAKVLEGFTNKRLLRQVSDTIDPRQYARHGHSTVHAH